MADVLLNAVTATGVGASKSFDDVQKYATVQTTVVDANTGISVVTVEVQCTLDNPGVADANASWFSIAEHTFNDDEITALGAMFHIYDVPFQRIRGKLTTATGIGAGDSVTMSIITKE